VTRTQKCMDVRKGEETSRSHSSEELTNQSLLSTSTSFVLFQHLKSLIKISRCSATCKVSEQKIYWCVFPCLFCLLNTWVTSICLLHAPGLKKVLMAKLPEVFCVQFDCSIMQFDKCMHDRKSASAAQIILLIFFLIIRNLKSTWLYILFTYFHLFIYMCFYSFIIGCCCCLCLRLTWLSSNLASLSCLDYTKCLFGSGRCLFKNLSMLRRSFQCWSSTLAIDHNK
jgi:hypothetical protein